MCFPGSANWKREVVPDHKFDFIDTRDYRTEAFGTRIQYLWLYVLLIKSFAVYLSDLFSAITMLTTHQWSNGIFAQCAKSHLTTCVVVDFNIGKWIFVGCIIAGYLLLLYEGYKAKKIIASRDISYTFTNVMAQNYYSLRSYDHFCFFQQLMNSTKKKDDFAFFVFFTFKGWKRLVLADGPRQSINCLTLYSFWLVNNGSISQITDYFSGQSAVTKMLLLSILFTVVIFLGSLLVLVIAAICYVPLLCYIQGNLKEYCCHKVDKRIAELIDRKNRQRIRRQAKLAHKEAQGDFSHLKNKKGDIVRNPVPQPTLPNLEIDEFSPMPRVPKAGYASSYATSAQTGPYGDYPPSVPDLNGAAPDYPPPMPVYDQYAYGTGPAPSFGGGGESMYPPSERHAGATEFANSSTHLAPHGGYDVDQYYDEHEKEHGNGNRRSLHQDGGAEVQRSSAYSGGLAYDAEPPTTPHRRTASGAYRGEEDFHLQQQQQQHLDYKQQWPGYGKDQYGREVYPQQPKGNVHGRQRSGGGGYGGAL